jgi:hypothetical protein
VGSGLSFAEAVKILGFVDVEAYRTWAAEADETELLVSIEILATLILGQ